MSALQDELTVVDVSVVRPAAATYVNAAARAEVSGAAVRDQAKRAQYENFDPLGYAFVLLSTETFARLEKPAMALLDKLSVCTSASGVVFKDGLSSMLCVKSLSGFVGAIVCCISAVCML